MAKMTLKVKKGAIITIETITGSVHDGKVIDLFPDRIVLVPQYYLSIEDIDSKEVTILNSLSVDTKQTDTIYRDKIVSWFYDYPVSVCRSEDVIILPSDIQADDVINAYNEDGFCKGEGEYLEE